MGTLKKFYGGFLYNIRIAITEEPFFLIIMQVSAQFIDNL